MASSRVFGSGRVLMAAAKSAAKNAVSLCSKFENKEGCYCVPIMAPSKVFGALARRPLMAAAEKSEAKKAVETENLRMTAIKRMGGHDIFNINTLILRKRLERQGLPPKIAVVVAKSMGEIINSCLKTASPSFAFQVEREKANLVYEEKFAQLKGELQSLQRLKFLRMLHEDEKISINIEKMRHELRCELSKEAASMRLLISTRFIAVKYCIGGIFSVCGVTLGIMRLVS